MKYWLIAISILSIYYINGSIKDIEEILGEEPNHSIFRLSTNNTNNKFKNGELVIARNNNGKLKYKAIDTDKSILNPNLINQEPNLHNLLCKIYKGTKVLKFCDAQNIYKLPENFIKNAKKVGRVINNPIRFNKNNKFLPGELVVIKYPDKKLRYGMVADEDPYTNNKKVTVQKVILKFADNLPLAKIRNKFSLVPSEAAYLPIKNIGKISYKQ